MLTSPTRVMQHIDPEGDEPHPLENRCAVFPLMCYYTSLARRKCTRDYLSNMTRIEVECRFC